MFFVLELRKGFFFFLFVFFSFSPSSSFAIFGKSFSQQHSFKKLGPQFYVPVQVEKISGSKLILFNDEAAKDLGLEFPEDPQELEKEILEQFSVFISKSKEPRNKELFSTYYQDSATKNVGDALGDGRAAWVGEIQKVGQSGRKYSIDVVLKGIGVTPLAWTNNENESHRDGLQNLSEAIYSYLMSKANYRNQLDTTVDLAVILLPEEYKNYKFTKIFKNRIERVAITLRVGNQTRMGHFRYFQDSPELFKKIFEYCLRRDMGLAADAPVQKKQFFNYIKQFSVNIAEEAARYYDLHGVHGSTTAGNRTTRGSTIDMSTWRYLDAYHQDFSYLKDKLLVKQQTIEMKNYIKDLFEYINTSEYYLNLGLTQNELSVLAENANQVFDSIFQQTLTRLFLARIGLGNQQFMEILETTYPDLLKRFYDASKALFEFSSSKTAILEGQKNVKPALFEPRKIFQMTREDSDFPSLIEKFDEYHLVKRQLGDLSDSDEKISDEEDDDYSIFGCCSSGTPSPQRAGFRQRLNALEGELVNALSYMFSDQSWVDPKIKPSAGFSARQVFLQFTDEILAFHPYVSSVSQLMELAKSGEMNPGLDSIKKMHFSQRLDVGTLHSLKEKISQHLVDKALGGTRLTELNSAAEGEIQKWVDVGLPLRNFTNLGEKNE